MNTLIIKKDSNLLIDFIINGTATLDSSYITLDVSSIQYFGDIIDTATGLVDPEFISEKALELIQDDSVNALVAIQPVLKELAEIKINTDAYILTQAPFIYDTNTYDGTDYSITLLHQAVAVYDIEGEVPAGFTWWDVDNIHHALLLADLKAMAVIIGNFREPIYQQARSDKDDLTDKTSSELIALL